MHLHINKINNSKQFRAIRIRVNFVCCLYWGFVIKYVYILRCWYGFDIAIVYKCLFSQFIPFASQINNKWKWDRCCEHSKCKYFRDFHKQDKKKPTQSHRWWRWLNEHSSESGEMMVMKRNNIYTILR